MARRASPARSLAISPKAPKRKYGFRPARSSFFHPMRVRLPVTSPSSTPQCCRRRRRARTPGQGLALQTWDAVHVDLLRAADYLGHGAANGGRGRAGIAQHAREDVGIEHAVDGDVVSAGFEAGDAADGIDERLAMVRPGAADEGAVDIEEDEGGGGIHGRGGWHFMMAETGRATQGAGWAFKGPLRGATVARVGGPCVQVMLGQPPNGPRLDRCA